MFHNTMPSAVQPVNKTPIRSRGAVKQHNQKLQVYLESIHWSEEQFSQERLEVMLAAACLRFLGGIENLSFVVGLSKAICKKCKGTMHQPLSRSTYILSELSEKLQGEVSGSSHPETVAGLVNDALEALTGQRWQ